MALTVHRAAAALLLVAACERAASPPERTAPWPAPAAPASVQAAAPGRYSVGGQSEATILLSTREARVTGRIPVLTGELTIDLADLTATRGRVRADLASIEIEAPELQSSDARAWLEVGSGRPGAERRRWAEFVITAVREVSAQAAYQGKRLGGASEETREVTLVAEGELTLHGARVAQTAELRARFHYARAAGPAVTPTRIEVETRQPLVVSLTTHDIKPRDAHGVVLAEGQRLLGSRVAREARVTVKLVMAPGS